MGHQPGSRRSGRYDKLRRRRLFAASLSLVVSLSLIGFQPAVAEDADTSGDDPATTEPVEETTPPVEEETTPPVDEGTTPPADETTPPVDDGSGEPPADEGTGTDEPPAEETLEPSSDELTLEQLGAVAALLQLQAQADASICTQGADCQIVRVHKEGLRDVPLENATFGIWPGSNTGGAPLATCTTGAGGSCDFSVNRPPNGLFSPNTEDYWVRETASPSPYNEILTMEVSGTDDYEDEVEVEGGSTFGGGSPAGTVFNSRDFVNWRDNPGFPTECGIDIALIIDRSNSINGTELGQMKTAANSFVDALTGTPSEVAVYSFGTDAATNLTSTSVSTVGGANTVKAAVNGLTTGGGGTNWDQAFRQVAAGADVAMMLTDGNPTFWGTPGNIQGPGNAATFDTVGEGVLSANAVKAAGAKIIGVGIGDGLSTTNLKLISGPTQNDDWYDSDFATLAATLQEIATRTCGGTITAVKEIPDGQGGWTPAAGWHFDTNPVAASETPADGNTTLPSGAVNFDFDNVSTVNVNLTEVVQGGWSLAQQGGKNAVCTKNGDPVGSTNIVNGVNVDVGPTDIISCVFRNEQVPGSITIVKDADPADDTTFNFTGDLGNFALQDPSDDTEGPVIKQAGTYTVNETLPAGWDLESVTCTGVASWNESGDGVVVNLASGEDAVCTFHNDRLPQPGSVTVEKRTIGGTGTFDFTLTAQPGSSATTTNETDFFTAAPAWTNLAPGNYTLGESPNSAWVAGQFSCTDQNQNQVDALNPVLTITDGENWTCQITNRKRPRVTVDKVTTPSGATTEFPFVLDPPLGTDDNFDLADGDAPFTKAYATPGTFTVTEDLTGLTGWELSGVVCNVDITNIVGGVSFDVDWGDEITCTFTNTGTGSVEVIKDTNPEGLTGVFPVTLDEDNGPYNAGWNLIDDDDMHTFNNVPAGSPLTLTESVPANWTNTSIVCDNDDGTFTVPVGQTVVCTVTNVPDPATIIVRKATNSPNAQDATEFSFTGSAGVGPVDDLKGGEFDEISVDPGTYTVTEADPGSEWLLYDIVCDDGGSGDVGTRTATFDLGPGDTVECTFHNGQAEIEVAKTIVTASPDATTFPFTGAVNTSLPGGGSTSVFVGAGDQDAEFQVTEGVVVGWDLTDIDCDTGGSGDLPTRTATYTVQAGDSVGCDFENTERGSITITKATVPSVGQSGPYFDFSGDLGGFLLKDGESSTFQNRVPGDYTQHENDEAGWELTGVMCSGGDYTPDVPAGDVTAHLDAGEHITCTFTNTQDGSIAVTKTSEGGTGVFDFSLTGQSNVPIDTGVSNPGSDGWSNLAPGSYDLAELDPGSEWIVGDFSCNYAGSNEDPVMGANPTVDLAAGQSWTCEITNTKKGAIIVRKETVTPNAQDATAFSFTGSAGVGPIDDLKGGESDEIVVDPGTYTVTEADPGSEWLLYNITCGEGGESIDVDTAEFDVAPGQTVECTFHNGQAEIEVAKETLPDGSDETFEFTDDIEADLKDGESASEYVGVGTDAGFFTVKESDKAGWTLADISCDDGAVGDPGIRTAHYLPVAGESITCTFTNEADGTIVVKKETITPNAADDTSFSFTGEVVADLKDGESAQKQVPPGEYGVSETVPDDWAFIDVQCTEGGAYFDDTLAIYTVAPGQTVECTWTNGQAEVEVTKVTDPPGSAQTFPFQGAGNISADLTDGESASGYVAADGQPTAYNVVEGVQAGWQVTDITCDDGGTGDVGSRTATYDVGPGDSVNCTFTNTELGSITVEKETDPAGGTGFAFDSTFGPFALDDGGSLSFGDLLPGDYDFFEQVPEGWELTDVGCVGGDWSFPDGLLVQLDAGEDITCTFENTQDAEIIVEKVTDPAGSDQEFDFDLKLGDDVVAEVDGLTDGTEGSFGFVTPDETYSVVEDVPDGWQQTGADCVLEEGMGQIDPPALDGAAAENQAAAVDPDELLVQPGEVWRCSFTNTELGSITVVKDTGGIEPTQEFPFTFQGDPFGLVDQQSQTFDGLLPGDYEVLEPADLMPQYWLLAAVECVSDHVANGDVVDLDAQLEPVDPDGPADVTDVTDGVQVALAAGENVTCTFANVQVFPAPGVTITKTPSITSGSPGDTVTYTYVVENTGQARLDNVKVVDDKLGEITLDKTTLEPGEKATGTKDYVLQTSDVGNLVNVAVVTADPEGGQDPVTADDDALVEVVQVQDQPPVTKTESGSLPFTGATIAGMVLAALAMLVGGSFLWAATKRRRREAQI